MLVITKFALGIPSQQVSTKELGRQGKVHFELEQKFVLERLVITIIK